MKKFKKWSGVILKKNDKVLLCKRSPDKSLPNVWSIPSGKIEKNETPGNAAIREYYEETNIKLPKEIELVGFIDRFNEDKTTKKGIMFVFFHETKKDLKPDLNKASDGFEHTECDFFTKENLPEQKGNEDLMKIIKKILK